MNPFARQFSPGRILLVLVVVFMYAPVLVVFAFSFNAAPTGNVWRGFSLHGYKSLLGDRRLLDPLLISIQLGLVASTLSVLLGTLAALGLRRWRQRPRRLATGLLGLPLVTPEIILGVSLAVFFHALAIPRGFPTLVLAHTVFGLSYAFVVMSAAVADLDDNLYAAALDCGATPWQAFWRVLVPILFPSLLVAWLMVFALSFDDFMISYLTGGVGGDPLPVRVYSQVRFGVPRSTNALFVLLFLVTLTGALFSVWLTRRGRQVPL